ncbi:MAG: hypothetical protein JNM39_15195 [Bdellovibrionaceae bacterium]|nr:hypothetical protein [Pseudobdellovibrionaceae bacterium]
MSINEENELIEKMKTDCVGAKQRAPLSYGAHKQNFEAGGKETDNGYSISEWWLEPNTEGPHVHAHDYQGLRIKKRSDNNSL